jgi:uncharacterized iron-regulated membrane protein
MSLASELSEDSAAAPAAPPADTPRRAPTGFTALLLRLHFYAGILVAPFLLVAALTGLAYTVTPQLDQIVYGEQLRAADTTGTVRPLTEQIAAARAAHPDGTLSSVAVGEGDATTRITFAVDTLTDDRAHTVYVNPHTAQVQGQLTTWFGYTPLMTWFDDLHRNLQLGVVGRYYSEVAASWLWVLVAGGLILWWRRRSRTKTARSLLAPELSAKKGVRRTRSWHASTGVWLAVGLLFLSITGLTWSRHAGSNFGDALDALRGSTPELTTTLDGAAASPGGGHHSDSGTTDSAAVDPAATDRALRVARDAGLSGPVEITPPQEAGAAWTVVQTDSVWPVHKDRVAVDPATSAVTDRVDFAEWPLLAKLSTLGIDAHMGILFGPVNQILLAALAIGLVTVIVWGYRMWWQRRPTRADRRALVGAPLASRGAWQKLPTWGIVVGVPVVFAIGWVVPVLGVTLLAFLAVDLILGAVAARRRRRTVPISPAPVSR